MALELADYERKARESVMAFWGNREKARQKQQESGKPDQASARRDRRKNMDGFCALVIDIIRANGLHRAEIHQKRALLTLPGYFSTDEALGLAGDPRPPACRCAGVQESGRPVLREQFRITGPRRQSAPRTISGPAYREGAFGQSPRPFVGWLMLVEERRSRTAPCGHLAAFPVFRSSRAHPTYGGMTSSASGSTRSSFTPRPRSSPRRAPPPRQGRIPSPRI
nr:type II site-specific deoxyribonuclease (EC 3.1.21.4) AbrI - Azospirillum brasilense [Azospirillum brasilense]